MVDAAHWHFPLSGITQSLLNSKCRFPSLFCPSGRPSATALSAMFKATQPTAIDRPSCVDCTDGSLMAAATSVTASLASPGDSSCSSAKDAAASFLPVAFEPLSLVGWHAWTFQPAIAAAAAAAAPFLGQDASRSQLEATYSFFLCFCLTLSWPKTAKARVIIIGQAVITLSTRQHLALSKKSNRALLSLSPFLALWDSASVHCQYCLRVLLCKLVVALLLLQPSSLSCLS